MKHPENMTQAELLALAGPIPADQPGARFIRPVHLQWRKREEAHRLRYNDYMARCAAARALGLPYPPEPAELTLTPFGRVTVERATGVATWTRGTVGGSERAAMLERVQRVIDGRALVDQEYPKDADEGFCAEDKP